MTHCACAAVAWKSRCRIGSAIETTVPSMKTRLEPMMLVTSVQRADRSAWTTLMVCGFRPSGPIT